LSGSGWQMRAPLSLVGGVLLLGWRFELVWDVLFCEGRPLRGRIWIILLKCRIVDRFGRIVVQIGRITREIERINEQVDRNKCETGRIIL
jgi:hypothetical protein